MTLKTNDKSAFRVIIVGGSIAGLTLAHCLSRANIDHIVLEKRAEIAPQEGAFIGIWPNGARVLDQLGLYSELEKLTVPIHRMHICYPDGFSFSSTLPDIVNTRFGYPIVSLDRQKVLEILYHRYPTKSNILVKKRVTEVQLYDHGAGVVTEDGAVYTGDLIVGADGVHSFMRSEMWRLADAEKPGLISHSERKCLTVEYACVFGISSSIPGLGEGEHINSYSDSFCVITFHGKDGRVFWFITKKLPQKFTYPEIPRFSAGDAAEFCEKLSSVRIWKNICVADLWANKECASMTALEEGLLQTWHFNRLALLGDSAHKVRVFISGSNSYLTMQMTPNIGQGANTAIEDAAILSSLINRLVTSGDVPGPSINTLLQEFHSLRYDRVKGVYQRSWFGTRFHTRDGLLKSLVGRYIFPYAGNYVAARASEAIGGGDFVDFLPIPKRSGSGWIKYNNNRNQTRTPQLQWALLGICPVILGVFCYLTQKCWSYYLII